MRILYVEDNPTNLFLVQRVARMGNHEVLNYPNGESALENFERDNPDLVLMDIQLAGALNGLEVVRKLRGSGYKTPIIAVTAYAMIGDRERCLEAGCDDYIAKPLPVPTLVEVIKRYDPQNVDTQPSAPTLPMREPSTSALESALPAIATPAAKDGAKTEAAAVATDATAELLKGLKQVTVQDAAPEPTSPTAPTVETPSENAPPESAKSEAVPVKKPDDSPTASTADATSAKKPEEAADETKPANNVETTDKKLAQS